MRPHKHARNARRRRDCLAVAGALHFRNLHVFACAKMRQSGLTGHGNEMGAAGGGLGPIGGVGLDADERLVRGATDARLLGRGWLHAGAPNLGERPLVADGRYRGHDLQCQGGMIDVIIDTQVGKKGRRNELKLSEPVGKNMQRTYHVSWREKHRYRHHTIWRGLAASPRSRSFCTCPLAL